MIQPTSLWAFLKETDDTELVGRVCRALGGQEVTPPLNCAEKAIYNVITKDNEWMNERIEAKKEQWRKRQEKSRSEKKVKDKKSVTHCHGDNKSVTVTKECHGDNTNVTYPPSLPSSLPPSLNTLSNESVYITRTPAQECDSEIKTHPTRGDIPSEKTVVTAATTLMGVPEAFARWWYKEMMARDWANTDGSPIGNRNWRPTLKAWFNRSTPEELTEIKRQAAARPTPVSYKPEDWLLCAERCAAFAAGRCTAGKIVPPQCRPHPTPPEECDKFRPSAH